MSQKDTHQFGSCISGCSNNTNFNHFLNLLFLHDVGSKSILTPLIPDCSVLRTPTILKNIRNPLIFLRKMATYSCFWRVPRSELFLQASLRQISNLLTLVSFHMLIYSTLFHCQSKVSWTRSFIFSPYSCIIIQHQ